jgi:hypothetical protein
MNATTMESVRDPVDARIGDHGYDVEPTDCQSVIGFEQTSSISATC